MISIVYMLILSMWCMVVYIGMGVHVRRPTAAVPVHLTERVPYSADWALQPHVQG